LSAFGRSGITAPGAVVLRVLKALFAWWLHGLLLVLAAVAAGCAGRTESMPLDVGSPAPDFAIALLDGRTTTLLEQAGNAPVVVYFYPKDSTPG
jgi:hypothetical protein